MFRPGVRVELRKNLIKELKHAPAHVVTKQAE